MLGVVLDLTRAILAPTRGRGAGRRRVPCGVTARRRATVTAPERLSKTRQFNYLHTHTPRVRSRGASPRHHDRPPPPTTHRLCTRIAPGWRRNAVQRRRSAAERTSAPATAAAERARRAAARTATQREAAAAMAVRAPRAVAREEGGGNGGGEGEGSARGGEDGGSGGGEAVATKAARDPAERLDRRG